MGAERDFKEMAKLVKKNRLKKGFSQIQLSKSIGYTNAQFVSNTERALCTIPIKKHAQLAEALEVDKEEIKSAYMTDLSTNYDTLFKTRNN